MSRDWVKLYALQDKVLAEISSIGSIALGGGTGLNRFITKESIRYSEDLDIFITPPFNEENLKEYTKKIYYQISNHFNTSSITSGDGNTKRFMVENELKIEILVSTKLNTPNKEKEILEKKSSKSPKIHHPNH